MTPEEKARQEIGAQLTASDWTTPIYDKTNLSDVTPLLPLAEQTRIVADMERRLSVVKELESVVTANLQRVSSLRQSLLQRAFIGGLV